MICSTTCACADVHGSTPWVEKYRPTHFDDIVLDDINKKYWYQLLNTIIFQIYYCMVLREPENNHHYKSCECIPRKIPSKNKGLMIHLNASDERGIDIIRNQINGFVTSKSMFGEGMKFVILDEVDYMTKNAQTALRYLLNNYNNLVNVRFCLICNYISRIDEALQTEFVRMRFNQLPESNILCFLKKINIAEKLNVDENILVSIQRHFNSDIRSMINYMQANQHLIHNCHVITNAVWESITQLFKSREKSSIIIEKLNEISLYYNIERKNIIKNYLNYIIRQHPHFINSSF